ncbi:hypothetical protein [Desulfosporosinus sp. FKB]|uniref:hypothetical protein n=1 Tax=Desulfosporosinus sp. FKB TaxID=1969835 RepID=UPI000B49E901|nr:hypothetical protein [Desulfosporosinus sp. FKB]
MEFETREDVLDWIITHQFARRNINDSQKAYLRGLQYENEKSKSQWRGNQHTKIEAGEDSSPARNDQNEIENTLEEEKSLNKSPHSNNTAEKLAEVTFSIHHFLLTNSLKCFNISDFLKIPSPTRY